MSFVLYSVKRRVPWNELAITDRGIYSDVYPISRKQQHVKGNVSAFIFVAFLEIAVFDRRRPHYPIFSPPTRQALIHFNFPLRKHRPHDRIFIREWQDCFTPPKI